MGEHVVMKNLLMQDSLVGAFVNCWHH